MTEGIFPAGGADGRGGACLDEAWLLEGLQGLFNGKAGGQRVAVLSIELDGFREVNSTLGRRAGAQLLATAYDRINCAVAEADLVARGSGPRFMVALVSVQKPAQITAVAERIIEFLRQPYLVDEIELYVSANVGISVSPVAGRDAEALLDTAEMALSVAKKLGRDRLAFHTPEMISEAAKRLYLYHDLHKALTNGELFLVYQPIIDSVTRKIVSLEALLRWQHPELGCLLPNAFMGVAEESGLIVRIGEWVLERAAEQCCRWDHLGLPRVQVNVNVSPKQFSDPDLAAKVRRILGRTGMPGERLQIEVTETAVMHDVDMTMRTLRELEELGVRVAIDDFGTGYTSLALLKQFRIDTIKIDRLFVEHIGSNRSDAAIVRAMSSIAESLNVKTVVEGVETGAQVQSITDIGCDQMQGFFFSRPIPVATCTELLRGGGYSPSIDGGTWIAQNRKPWSEGADQAVTG